MEYNVIQATIKAKYPTKFKIEVDGVETVFIFEAQDTSSLMKWKLALKEN